MIWDTHAHLDDRDSIQTENKLFVEPGMPELQILLILAMIYRPASGL